MCCLKKAVSEVEGEKSGADMENRLAEIITDIIFQHTSCDYHKDGGFFTCEIYADYRDYAENSTVIKWCEADNPHEAFNEELFCWYQDCIFECEDDVIDTVKRHWTDAEFSFDDNEEFIVDWIRDHVTFEIPVDHYRLQFRFRHRRHGSWRTRPVFRHLRRSRSLVRYISKHYQ